MFFTAGGGDGGGGVIEHFSSFRSKVTNKIRQSFGQGSNGVSDQTIVPTGDPPCLDTILPLKIYLTDAYLSCMIVSHYLFLLVLYHTPTCPHVH